MFTLLQVLTFLLVGRSLADATLGIQFVLKESSLPTLKLPYGTFRAVDYDDVSDIYTFKNIRFAAPPVGDLRWAEPAPPIPNATVQDGSYGYSCPQGLIPQTVPVGQEDCLFLDLYVPGSAIRDTTKKLSVVVWTFGGAFVMGSKDFYDGTGPVVESGNELVFITYNYRLGSFGFLAGTSMEQQGLPNAGFYDQRAVFQWVQDYVHLVGGDKTQVTAWGESAGATSVLMHITAFGGKQDPLFHKAILQSIASELLPDRRGEVEGFYQKYLALANCSGQSLQCLRSASFETLEAANNALIPMAPAPVFQPNPASDGSWVRQMPALELASGNYWKDLSGLILSHTGHEAEIFAIGAITSDAGFVNLTNFNVPAYAPSVRQAVADYYPSPNSPGSPFATQDERTIQFLDDTIFLCNYRYLNAAFKGKTWSMQYSIGTGFHGSDVAPTFFNGSGADVTPEQATLFRDYQSYLDSFTLTGNPNARRSNATDPPTIKWPGTIGALDEYVSNVLNVTDAGFELITDQESLRSRCEFFLDTQAAVTLAGGYVPPGGEVPNHLNVTNPDPSGNYTTPAGK